MGLRVYCLYCGINYDSLQLYCHTRDVQLYDAITDLLPVLGMPQEEVTKFLPQYVRAVRVVDGVNHLFSVGGKMLIEQPRAEWIRVLESLGVWNTRDAGILKTMSKCVAGVDRREVDVLLPKLIRLPKRTSPWMLMLRSCDIYDRPRSITLINHKLSVTIPLDLPGSEEYPDHGLTFAELLSQEAKDVIAIKDPVCAAQILLSYQVDSLSSCPIVGWTAGSTASFDRLGLRKVILWEKQPSLELFAKAMYIRTAYIALSPTIEQPMESYLRQNRAVTLVRNIVANAIPWREALMKHLLAMDKVDAILFFTELRVSPEDAQRILDITPPADLQTMQWITGASTKRRQVEYDGSIIEERERCWYVSNSDMKNALLIAATITLEKILDVDGKKFFVGYYNIGDHTVAFQEPLDKTFHFRTMEKAALAAGVTPPVLVVPKFCTALMRIAQLIAGDNLQLAYSVRRVRYNSNYGFVFPKFQVRNGTIYEAPLNIMEAPERLPGAGMLVPNTSKPLHPDINFEDDSTAVFFAILGAIYLNLKSSQTDGRETRGIVVLTNGMDAGQAAVDRIAAGLSLPTLLPENLSQQDVGHCLPGIVRASAVEPSALMAYAENWEEKSLLLTASSVAAWRNIGFSGVLVIDGRRPAKELGDLDPAACLVKTLLCEDDPFAITNHQEATTAVWSRQGLPVNADTLRIVAEITTGDDGFMTTAGNRALFPVLNVIESVAIPDVSGDAVSIPYTACLRARTDRGDPPIDKRDIMTAVRSAGWSGPEKMVKTSAYLESMGYLRTLQTQFTRVQTAHPSA